MSIRVLVAFVLTAGAVVTAQAPPPSVRPEVMGPAEANLVMQGWAALSRGDLNQASERVAQIDQISPRSVHAMLLNIEVNMARAGAMAALNGYEGWLGNRRLDDPAALRRIARGLLFELSRLDDSIARLDALSALATDGDSAAQTTLIEAARTGSLADIRLLASKGHPGAITRLVEALSGPVGNKIALVDALVESGSPQVIPALAEMLRDPRPEHRASAADGLGRLGAADQLNALTALLTHPRSTLPEQVAAAGALLRLGNTVGLPQLELWMRSDVSGVRLAAAQALAARRDDAWLDVVRGLAHDSDPLIRLDAVKLIAPYDRTLAVASVERLMSDEHPAVREGAVRAFATHLAADFDTLRRLFHSTDAVTQAVAAGRVLELTK